MRCFRGGPFRTVAVPRAGGSGGNRVRGMEGLALDLVTCRPRDFGHARQPPWASFSLTTDRGAGRCRGLILLQAFSLSPSFSERPGPRAC